ncbi:NAD(P)-dependent oxidoreductase [Streptomyces bauhiniae]
MADPDSDPQAHDVAVIGCGLMGAALARTLAGHGHAVAAWNRTPERAEALAQYGIKPVRSLTDAVAPARLVVSCLADYESTLAALDPVTDWRGTTLVNVASGAPDEARQAERWATERGAEYLDGVILGYPRDIGSPEAMLLFAGSPTAWSAHEPTLMTLGGASVYVSDQVAAASLLDVGIVGGFVVTALAAYVEAATYVLGEGLAPEVVQAGTLVALQGIQQATDEISAALVSGEHTTDQATLSTYAAGARAALAVMRGAGLPARLLTAATENLAAAERAGLGDLGFSAQSNLIGRGAGKA